jgi:hypothetical protein
LLVDKKAVLKADHLVELKVANLAVVMAVLMDELLVVQLVAS